MTPSLDGVLVVDKPDAVTSHDVVAAVRRQVPRRTRVGHTGTLDPFATGVLPLVIGKATRLAQFLTATRKGYVAAIAFGTATDTGDCTGETVATAPADRIAAITADAVARALASFVGTQAQVPPAHSAKKVDGERAYVLARRGTLVDLPAVDVTAFALRLLAWDPDRAVATVDMETSAGYYVRSLARDLGGRLGVPSHLAALRRTRSGEFTLADAATLDVVVGPGCADLGTLVRPMGTLLPDLPALQLEPAQVEDVMHGRLFEPGPGQARPGPSGRVRLLAGTTLVGLGRAATGAPHLVHADIVLGQPAG